MSSSLESPGLAQEVWGTRSIRSEKSSLIWSHQGPNRRSKILYLFILLYFSPFGGAYAERLKAEAPVSEVDEPRNTMVVPEVMEENHIHMCGA